MNIIRLTAGLLVVLLAASTAPLGNAQIPEIPMTTIAEIPVEVTHSENFDEDNGGWTASPVPPPEARPAPEGTWDWGAPTSGPGFAASGSNVWATNLAGNHDDDMCVALLSPPIDLTGASSASVSFESWIHSYQSSFGSQFVFSGGAVFATTDGGETLSMLSADGGYSGPMGTDLRECMDDAASGTEGFGGPPSNQGVPDPVYSTINVDLSSQLGSTIQFLIAFESYCCNERAGWYVDDFAVTIDGASTVEDFEVDNGGFELVSTAKPPAPPRGWDHGVPGEGPGSDSPMWGTNVAGDYGHKECAWVESPEIDFGLVPGAAAGIVSANLTWDHWYRSNSLYAAGIVQIGVGDEYHYVTPTAGYPGKATGTYSDQLHACLGEESAEGAFSGIHDREGDPMAGQEVDLTPFIGETITVRFLFASAWSTLNPTIYPGWYVDNVEVATKVTVTGPDAEQIVADLTEDAEDPAALLTTQAPGWTTGGFESSWAYGLVSDPDGPEGEFAYGTNLAGVHNEDECSWIDSPAIPGALLAQDPTLTISHWFHQYHSSFSGTAWNAGVLFTSTDGGATWQYLNADAYTSPSSFSGLEDCVESVDPTAPDDFPSFSGEQEFFNEVSVDLSAFADADAVQVRFLQGSGIGIERSGWYLESIDVGGLSLLPPL